MLHEKSKVNIVSTLFSIIFKNIFQGFFQGLKYTLTCVLSFLLVYYIWFPILLIPFIVFVTYRAILSLIFKSVYRQKYKLMEAADATHTFDSYANVNTVTLFLYINGVCDIEELQARVEKLFLQYSRSNGKRPYWKLLHLARKKFGFMVWEDMSSSFNVENHVRYFPGFDQRNQIYRESDLFEAVSELSCKEWDYTKPKWEFLITPQLKMDNENQIYSALTVRISHEYGDGISIMQMFRKHIFDKPSPKLLIDPVNPPIPKIPFYVKFVTYLQAFLLGPWCIMKFLSYKDKESYSLKGSLTGPKYFGRNSMEIPLGMIRKIRKHFCVSTSAIFHSAFCGAFRTMAEKKDQPIPDTAIGGMAYGKLPYPNDHLQNHFTPLGDEYPIGIENRVERVKEIEKCLRAVVKPYSLLTTSWTYASMGLLPASAIKATLGVVNVMFVVSNVPGLIGDVRFGGYPVQLICGSPPSCKGISKFINESIKVFHLRTS